MVSGADGDVAMTDSSASSLNSPESPQKEQSSRGLDARAIAPAQGHQQPSFRDRVARDVGVKSRHLASDGLSREKGPQLQLTSIPSTPPSRMLAPSDLSPATPSVRRKLFSSPAIPLEFPDKNRPPGSLGLGITGSPSADGTQTHHQKRIVAGKSAQAKRSLSVMNESVKHSDGGMKGSQIKKRKDNQRRVRWRNQKEKMEMKLQMRKIREGNNQAPVQSSHCSDSQTSTAANQLLSHSPAPEDESPSQIAASSLPLAQESSGQHHAAKQAIASDSNTSSTDSDSMNDFNADVDAKLSDHVKRKPPPFAQVSSSQHPAAEAAVASDLNNPDTDSDTDSDSTSDSETDVDAELFGHMKPEPPKPVVAAYRSWVGSTLWRRL